MKASDNQLLFLVLALLAGGMIPFQSAMNSQLGRSLQSPYFSALTVFVVAAIGLTIYNLASQQTVPALTQFSDAPKWSYLGGVLGGSYILLIVICAPKLGIGNVTIMVLLGQILAAMLIDHFGLLNATLHPINWQRLIGVGLLIAGVYIVRKF
ncbi:DMT family transporter [Spirosoma sp. SC4-14]|uniref:DMT family transporter n=1 Tax=Spirosoma sp. SC4-14 TaxID=3128900 RepID=UPI0030D1FA34